MAAFWKVFFILVAQGIWAQASISEGFMSSCPKTGTTAWNKDLIGENIKYWIKSIDVIGSDPVKDKLIQYNDESGFLSLFSRLDAKTSKPVGNAWKVVGQNKYQYLDGFLVGPLDKSMEITGDKVVFLFPDMETVLVGRWKKSVMKEARAGRIVAERCENGVKVFKIRMSKKNTGVYKYQRPTRDRPGDQPSLGDPYEQRTIYIGPGVKDDGVFAKRDIRKGELVAYYSGVIVHRRDVHSRLPNMTRQQSTDMERNYIHFNDEERIDIPQEFWNIIHFRGTLGHKLNHSFVRNKTKFMFVTHPRYGLIRGVMATHDIAKGEETFVSYNYATVKGSAPDWYEELYTKETGGYFQVPQSRCQNRQ